MIETASRRTLGLGLAALPLVVAAALIVLGHQPQRFTSGGLTFAVPSSWRIHDQLSPTTGLGQTYALLGTMPWGPCEESDINCHFRERLDRHEIQVDVGISILSSESDFCSYARERPDMDRTDGVRVMETHYIRIDGRPAISTTYSLDQPGYYLADGWKTWMIAPADTTSAMYSISAEWRGPGDDEFLAQLDQLVASVQLGPSGYASATTADCGDPFAAAAE